MKGKHTKAARTVERVYHSISGHALQAGFEVKIVEDLDEGTKRVFFTSRWHKPRAHECRHIFDSGVFTDAQILHSDHLKKFVREKFGVATQAVSPPL